MKNGLFAFHTIMHNRIIIIINHKKNDCTRTKCESIILTVITPYAIQQMLDELKYIMHDNYGGHNKP